MEAAAKNMDGEYDKLIELKTKCELKGVAKLLAST